MSINLHIKDPNTGVKTGVTGDRELCVIPTAYPSITPQKVRPFRQYFTDDGTIGGSNDMGVDGSSTEVDFFIPANPEEDRYITALNFIVGYGTSGQPNKWADGVALTNGIKIFYSSQSGEIDIHDGIKSNQDLFRLSFNVVASLWELRHVNANNDYGYFLSMDITKLGLLYGIKLDRGTRQKLTIRIQDNVGFDADSFNCIAYGFDRFE